MADTTRLRQPPIVTVVDSDMLLELTDVNNRNRPVRAALSTVLGGSVTNIAEPTGDVTLTADDTGLVISNAQATGLINVYLPASINDAWFGFVRVVPHIIRVWPLAGESIADCALAHYIDIVTVGSLVIANYAAGNWTPEIDSVGWYEEI